MLHYIILIQYTYYVTFDMIYGQMIDIQSEMYYIHCIGYYILRLFVCVIQNLLLHFFLKHRSYAP